MNLDDAARAVQAARELYLHWREIREEVHTSPLDVPISGWLAQECLQLDADAPLADRDALEARLAGVGAAIRRRLQATRRESWYQQGKMLRYALVLLEQRAEIIRRKLQETGQTLGPDGERILDALGLQIDTIRGNLQQWQQQRVAARLFCSVDDVQALIDDPLHQADKEHLERIAARALDAGLPATLLCIALEWDGITGEVIEARVTPIQDAKAA